MIRKILLLIRAITQCHNYQCHQLVCNEFLLHPGTDCRPPYITYSQLHYLIGYMQIGPKLKATCKGTPRGTVLYTHIPTPTHTHTHIDIMQYYFFSFNLQLSQWEACHLPSLLNINLLQFPGCRCYLYNTTITHTNKDNPVHFSSLQHPLLHRF